MSYKSNYIPKNRKEDFEKLKRKARYLLWEYDIRDADNSFLKRMFIERIMQFGDLKEIRLLFKIFTYNDLADYLFERGWRILSGHNFNFWFKILKNFSTNNINWKLLQHRRQLHKARNPFWIY